MGAVVGVPLLAYSADLAAAGINQAATGEQTNTFFFEGTKKTAKGLGASEEAANNIAIGTDIVVGAYLTGGASNVKNLGTVPKVVAGGGAVGKVGANVLQGAVKSNYERFLSKMPANAKSNATYKLLDDGNYLFQAASPGKVPGSSAMYQKWVNPQGETFKMLKTTNALIRMDFFIWLEFFYR